MTNMTKKESQFLIECMQFATHDILMPAFKQYSSRSYNVYEMRKRVRDKYLKAIEEKSDE